MRKWWYQETLIAGVFASVFQGSGIWADVIRLPGEQIFAFPIHYREPHLTLLQPRDLDASLGDVAKPIPSHAGVS